MSDPLDLDLAPIRERLAIVSGKDLTPTPATRDEYYSDYSVCGNCDVLVWSAKEDVIPPLAIFIGQAPTDIAALIAEVERLRADLAWQREMTDIVQNIVADLHAKLAKETRR